MSLRLNIGKQTAVRVPRKKLQRLFTIVTGKERRGRARGQVNLVFTDDRRMAALNRRFRGRPGTTDVLSFNIDTPGDDEALLGEIYISVPRARRQAHAYGGTFSGEILRLFCHGLLHLFGYDHATDREAQLMRRREQRYLEAVGERFVP